MTAQQDKFGIPWVSIYLLRVLAIAFHAWYKFNVQLRFLVEAFLHYLVTGPIFWSIRIANLLR